MNRYKTKKGATNLAPATALLQPGAESRGALSLVLTGFWDWSDLTNASAILAVPSANASELSRETRKYIEMGYDRKSSAGSMFQGILAVALMS